MKRLLPLLLLLSCKAHFESEQQTHATTAETVDSAQQIDTHIVDAPDRTTTTVEEYALPAARTPRVPLNWDSAAPASAGQVSQEGGASIAAGTVLVKRTVTVTEHGAVTIDTHAAAKSQEREDSTLDEQHKSEESFDFLHSPFALLGGLVALAGAAFAAFKLLKPRLLP